MAGSIKIVQRVLVGGVFYGGLNRAHRLAFVTVFGIKVVIAYFSTLAPVGVVNKF